jgi:Uma2 family endonuclease
MTMKTKLRMSEQEYLATYANEQPPWEYDDGEVTQKRTMTQDKHVIVATEFTVGFYEYYSRTGGFGGQTPTTNFSDEFRRRYRVPDYGYWAPGRPRGSGIFEPPTLAVEIVSPEQSARQLREKCRRYLEMGVDVCWLIQPEHRWVEVFDAENDGLRLPPDGVLESGHIPGFSLPLRTLWDALDRFAR